MTKSLREIAMDLEDLVERDANRRSVDQRRYNYRVSRDCELAIEAILRREFGDNNGPALERAARSDSTIVAKIDEKSWP